MFVSGPGAMSRNSIGIVLVTGMTIGTVFTLFVVPSVYMLLAARHKRVEHAEGEQAEAKPILKPMPEPALAMA